MQKECYKILAMINTLQRQGEGLPPLSPGTKQALINHTFFSELPEKSKLDIQQFMDTHDDMLRKLRSKKREN